MKATIVVSWVAWFYDFVKETGQVNEAGPTYDMHLRFFGKARPHTKHVLLSSGEEGEERSALLYTKLKQDFPDREIALTYVGVLDPFDFQELKARTEEALAPYRTAELDVLYSNGTSPMRMIWLVLHLEQNGLNMRLIQGKSREVTKGDPDFPEIQVDTSLFAHRIRIRALTQDTQPDAPLRLEIVKPVYEQAEKIADVEGITTLIEGESGTGKELLARYLHEQSARKGRRMISVNCAAMGNDDLLESRLFGYKAGAFTGADQDQSGLFEAADRSTIFLDEIGDISPHLQQSLLRVLQERRFSPVGSTEERSVDIRVIAATNKDLWAACEAGTFRWDLYYRLTQTRLALPPLRSYPIAELRRFLYYFLERKAHEFERPILKLTQQVEYMLLHHKWPGNVRELENLIVHAYVFANGEVQITDLPKDFVERHQPDDMTLETVKKRHVRRVYDIMDGNVAQTAKALGISDNTVRTQLGLAPVKKKKTK